MGVLNSFTSTLRGGLVVTELVCLQHRVGGIYTDKLTGKKIKFQY